VREDRKGINGVGTGRRERTDLKSQLSFSSPRED
jgi:hypothetical protein